jgi:hypothetical protein
MTIDPTGTSKLRSAFRVEVNRYVTSFLTHIKQAISVQDLLGVGGLLIPHPAMFGVRDPGGLSTKLQVFTNYINQLGYCLLVRDAVWLRPHIANAFAHGLAAGERWTKIPLNDGPAELDFLHAKAELEGIVDAITQQTTRVVAVGLRKGLSSAAMYRTIMVVVRKIQASRLNALGHQIVVHQHALGRIHQFRHHGYKLVGIIPEKKRSSLVKDSLGNIETAGDDAVCPICEDLALNGPYDLDEAESMIPVHPDCRCAPVPADDTEVSSSEALQEELLGEVVKE